MHREIGVGYLHLRKRPLIRGITQTGLALGSVVIEPLVGSRRGLAESRKMAPRNRFWSGPVPCGTEFSLIVARKFRAKAEIVRTAYMTRLWQLGSSGTIHKAGLRGGTGTRDQSCNRGAIGRRPGRAAQTIVQLQKQIADLKSQYLRAESLNRRPISPALRGTRIGRKGEL